MSEQIEQRVFNVENLMSYMAETQRMMADNITGLSNVQISMQGQNEQFTKSMQQQQEKLAQSIIRLTDAQAEMQQKQAEYQQKHAEYEQKHTENDARFNVLLAEIRHLSKRVNED